MKKKAFITGINGQDGSYLSEYLLEKDYKVTVLDNFIYRQNSLLHICYHPNLNIIVGDVRDKKRLKAEI